MFGDNKVLEYGIAVNYLGNYRSEGGFLNNMTRELTGGLLDLRGLLVGGSLVGAFAMFGNKVMQVGTMMEQNFANLKATLGSTAAALEQLEWARVKGATTPFEIPEVNRALSMMHTMGFARDNEQREKTFNAVGDFAALRGYGFDDVLSRVARASFGNWEALGDSFGIRKQTIGSMARERVAKAPDQYSPEQVANLDKWIQTVEKGKNGTQEMKEAIVALIGVLGAGGLEAKLNTVGGVMSNLSDIASNFWMNLVGYSQVEGTFWNNVKNTLKFVNDEFSKTLEIQQMMVKQADGTYKSVEKNINAIDMLGNIGKGVGQILSGVFASVDSAARNATGHLIGYVKRMNDFFSDYENNIAPLILFFALMKIEVEIFFKSLWDGFTDGFKVFGGTAKMLWDWLVELIKWTGILGENANATAYAIGLIGGAVIGIKVLGVVANPFFKLAGGAIDAVKWVRNLWRTLAATRAVATATTATNALTGATAGATAAQWGLNAAVLANPITWAAVAIAALIVYLGYLVTHWDEVGAAMEDVGDGVQLLLAIFAPLIGVPLIMAENWGVLKSTWTNIWHTIRDVTYSAYLWIREEVFKPIYNWFTDSKIFGPMIRNLEIIWLMMGKIGGWIKEQMSGNFIGQWLGWGDDKSKDMAEWAADMRANAENKYLTPEEKEEKRKAREKELAPYSMYMTPPNSPAPTVPRESETKNNFNGATINIQLPNVTKADEFAEEFATFGIFGDISNKKGK